MKRILVSIVVAGVLAPAAVFAEASPADAAARANGIGALAGGALGGLVAGPPGIIAGIVLGGATSDWRSARHRAAEAEERTAGLELERDGLREEQQDMIARLESLQRALGLERAAAEEAARLAHGLAFSIGFRTNSAEPPEEALESFSALAQLLAAVPSLEVHLDGYADPRGGEALNLELSAARAERISERLVAAGVPQHRIHVSAHGAASADGSADPDGWALQRRVGVRLESAEGRLAARP
jgi:outer membrane protein OmpA-like peptidoglycan-associated protein